LRTKKTTRALTKHMKLKREGISKSPVGSIRLGVAKKKIKIFRSNKAI
jgi:hypothetical protein